MDLQYAVPHVAQTGQPLTQGFPNPGEEAALPGFYEKRLVSSNGLFRKFGPLKASTVPRVVQPTKK